MEACLRQNSFMMDSKIKETQFEDSLQQYMEFLYLCEKNPGKVMTPTEVADYMWHAHMQDPEAYKNDMRRVLGSVLNHCDNYS